MSSLICRICLDLLQNKSPMSTTCGHIFCSECANSHWRFPDDVRECPACRDPQAFDELIRLFPEYAPQTHALQMPPASLIPHPPLLLQPPLLSQPPLIPHPHPPADLQPIPQAHPIPPPVPAYTRDVATLRIKLPRTGSKFPWTRAGPAQTTDQDGSPVFLGIAAFRNGMHPCKVRPNCSPMAWVSYGGKEYAHTGTAYLLPFDPSTMEWVPTSNRHVPYGRTPVKSGFEPGYHRFGRDGRPDLFHALAVVPRGVKVPGKAGAHLNGANVPFEDREYQVLNYEILCWRQVDVVE